MLESEVEKYLRERVEELGGRADKLKFLNTAGAPDRLVALNGRLALVELKAPSGRLSKIQQWLHREYQRAGVTVFTAYTKGQVDEVLATLVCTKGDDAHSSEPKVRGRDRHGPGKDRHNIIRDS